MTPPGGRARTITQLAPKTSNKQPAPNTEAAVPSIAPSQVALQRDMRKLWEEHVTWTRLSIVSALSGLPDAQPTAERLLRDQDEIGAAVKPFYGDEAGTKLTQLLRTHITQAADLLTAANADDIAASLSQANPESWPADQVKAMMHMHLDQTISEATNRLKGNYTAEIADSDATENHILTLADTLSSGLVAQFPDKFRA